MTQVVDRRAQPGTTTSSRERFVRRNKKHIKEAVDRAISNGNVTDIGSGGVDVTVPKRDLSEPFIHHGQGGINDRVHPGNKEFIKGDRIPRPQGGGGRGSGKGEASEDGEGEDDFTFHLSEEEFLNYLFDDLALPNLEEKKEADLERTKLAPAGIVSSGAPNKLHLLRSKRQKMGRVIAARKPWNDKILELLAEEKEILGSYDSDAPTEKIVSGLPKAWSPKRDQIRGLEKEVSSLKDKFGVAVSGEHAARIADIEIEIAAAKRGISLIPGWNESTDLKFRLSLPKPIPNSKAVMFCVMDVSGSMDEETKNKAKIFYFLLYRFLKRHYQKTDVVFIRHHTQAEEVNEHDFFYKKESGGTMVSSALTLMKNIMNQRYNDGNWNIYGAQASDGDNWESDNGKCRTLMDDILKDTQAYFYTEITDGSHQNLWRTYENVKSAYPEKFWMGHIVDRKDIFPVFREFFKRNGKDGQSVASQLKPQAYAIG